MSDDWNSDGLNDSYDEAHEFGIDLDGGGGAGGPGGDDDGFDLGMLAVFDAADLLGADLVAGVGVVAAGDGAGLAGVDGVDVAPVTLPFGEGFASMVERLGNEPLPTVELLGFIAGLSVANPFLAEEVADDVATAVPSPAAPSLPPPTLPA